MNQTIDDNRIIGANELQEMHTYANLSHVVHMDMRGYTGGVSTFGIGVLTAESIKQNMNLISSNGLEVIGNSEYLLCNNWYENLLEA